MTLISAILTAVLALHSVHQTSAAPHNEVRAAGAVCGSGIYGELSPILARYPIALAFCSAVYPVSCTSSSPRKRAASPATTTTTSNTASTTSQSAGANDRTASAWAKCRQQPARVISTLCYCIETPKPCRTTTTTTSKSTTTPTTTTKPTTTTTTTKPTTTTTTTPTTTTTTTTTTTITTTTTTTTPTTTTTTTTTAAPPNQTCSPNGPGVVGTYGNIFGSGTCTYTVTCGTTFSNNPTTGTTAGSLQACINVAASFRALGVRFTESTGDCAVYTESGGAPADTVPQDGVDTGVLEQCMAN